MDYSEALIRIQQAKDKASQACRERNWEEASEHAQMVGFWARQLEVYIGLADPRPGLEVERALPSGPQPAIR